MSHLPSPSSLWNHLRALAPHRKCTASLSCAVLALGFWTSATVSASMLAGLRYPYELEWMEGAILDHVRYLLAHGQLYLAPSVSFTPFIYPPLFYLATAALRSLGIPLMLAARLVSATSTAGAAAILASAVRREGGKPWHVAVALGAWFASYFLLGGWFELARVDSLALFLWLAAMWTARFGTGRSLGLRVALLLFLALLTKQTAALLAIPPLLYLLRTKRLQGFLASTVFLFSAIAAMWLGDRLSGGWMFYYLLALPSQHPMVWSNAWPIARDLLLSPLAPAWIASLSLLYPSRKSSTPRTRLFYFSAVLVACVVAFLSLLHKDGFVNVLIPAYAMLFWTSAVALVHLERSLPLSPRVRSIAVPAIRLLAMAIIFLPFHDPSSLRPSPRDRKAIDRIVAELRQLPKPVLMLDTGYYAYLAGDPNIHAHAMALADVFKSRDAPTKRRLLQQILRSLQEHHYRAVVTGKGLELLPPAVRQQLVRSYRPLAFPLPPEDRPYGWPKRGFRSRPAQLWLPRSPSR